MGLILLGTATLLALQRICAIPDWMQHASLTVLIVAEFVASSCLAEKPTNLRMEDHALVIESRTGEAREILWANVAAYTYYEELVLHSLKIRLSPHEIVSIISFKWSRGEVVHSFWQQLELRLDSGGYETPGGSVGRSNTF